MMNIESLSSDGLEALLAPADADTARDIEIDLNAVFSDLLQRANAFLPVFKFWQSRGFPVCILPQGWVQTPFHRDRKGRSKCPHQTPADPSPKFPCPAAMRTSRRIPSSAAQTEAA